jgi:hypothetical protein
MPSPRRWGSRHDEPVASAPLRPRQNLDREAAATVATSVITIASILRNEVHRGETRRTSKAGDHDAPDGGTPNSKLSDAEPTTSARSH